MLGRGGRGGICRVVFIDVIRMGHRNAFEKIWLFSYCCEREVGEVDGSRHLERIRKGRKKHEETCEITELSKHTSSATR